MSLQQKLSLKLQQRMVLTPTLQQAIRLLQLTRLELVQEVSQELQINPVLEDATTIEEPVSAPSEEEAALRETAEENPMDRYEEKIDVESYFQDFIETSLKYRGTQRESPEEAPDTERYLSAPESLAEHLEWQVSLSRLSPTEREVAQVIIGNLREDGYLMVSLEDVCAATGGTPEDAESVLRVVQHMDPVGVAARDLKECLRIQLMALEEPDELALRIVEEFLPLLEREKPAQLASRLGVTEDRLEEALDLIRHLDPKPGLRYNNPVNPTIVPEVVVEKEGDGYRVLLNEDGMPHLRISNRYRSMAEEGSAEESQETLTYLKEKMRSALWFLKSLEERQRTIYKVATQIVEFQRDFLDKGRAHMRPLILRDVAERVGVHESTVSRVVSNKYMQTPRGILPMKYFFNTGIGTMDGGDVSAMRVKERLKGLVDAEDPRHPLSDQVLADLLKREGILLARRTVAKYREELNIPSSGRRKSR
ncbi:MAG: RNA polymerase factor sigma-54 [Acidobacteriota bacterium]